MAEKIQLMIEIIPAAIINIETLKVLRRISLLSIPEIKEAAKSRRPIFSIEEFSGEWEENRKLLSRLSALYLEYGSAIFSVQVKEPDSTVIELSVEGFINKLKYLRSIELGIQKTLI